MELDYLLFTSLSSAQERIMSYLQPKDMLALQSVSSSVKNSINDGMTSNMFNINLHLEPFFSNPTEFRTYQAQAGALIGGEFARAFFNNSAPSIEHLEIFVHRIKDKHERAANRLIGHIAQASSGYVLVSPIDRSQYGPADLVFSKIVTNGKTLTVAVYCTRFSPLHALLHIAATTATTNFISSDKAYALFAQHTFVQRTANLLQNLEHAGNGAWYHNQLSTLKPIGIKPLSLDLNDQFDDSSDLLATRIRQVNDDHTWKVDLDTTNVAPSDNPTKEALEIATFKIRKFKGTNAERGPIDRYTMNAYLMFCHSALKNIYVTITDTTGKSFVPR